MASQPLRRDEPGGAVADLTQYWRDGYAIVRGFFDTHELRDISTALDQLYNEGAAHGRSFRHGNLFYNVAARSRREAQPLVRMVQWPSYHQPVMNAVRLDTRFAELLDPLIGNDLKQIINQVHWKAPSSLGRLRLAPGQPLPRSAVRLSQSWRPPTSRPGSQSIRIRPSSGCMRFIPQEPSCAAISAWIARRGRWARR